MSESAPRSGRRDAERDSRAALLRAEGLDFGEIATRLGYSDRSGAFRAVRRGLKGAVRESTAEALHIALIDLESVEREAWTVLRATHYVVSRGSVVAGPDGSPLHDDAPVLAAIDRVLKVQERRSRLLGLDAPARVVSKSSRKMPLIA